MCILKALINKKTNFSCLYFLRPLDILGIDNDRQAIICVFGAATGSILGLISNSVQGRNAWEIGIDVLLTVLSYTSRVGCSKEG